MKILKISIIVLTLLFLFASCDKNCSSEIASDQLRFADSIERDNKIYYLYTLTTGWNDKAVYFQLYEQKPILDKCKKADIKPIYEIVYDDYPEMQYVKAMILQPDKTTKLKIIYTKDKNKGVANIYDVKFAR